MTAIKKLKNVEAEHLDVIQVVHRDLDRLRVEEAKLKSALEVLRTHSLRIPDEYDHKLRKQGEQISGLEERLKHEKMLLKYLHASVIPTVRGNKIAIGSDLLAIALGTVIIDSLILMFSFDGILARIIGLLFLLIFPGYALLALVFPRTEDLDVIERVAFSIGLSIAVILMLSYGLNGTSQGRLELLLSLTIAIFLCCGIAVLRRNRKLNFSPSSIMKWIRPAEDS